MSASRRWGVRKSLHGNWVTAFRVNQSGKKEGEGKRKGEDSKGREEKEAVESGRIEKKTFRRVPKEELMHKR
jgi:hypothetical protein